MTSPPLIAYPITYRPPVIAFAPLANEAYAVLLGGGGTAAQSRFSYIAADAFEIITVKPGQTHDPFAALRETLRQRRVAPQPALPAPFIGGAVGFIGYEIGALLERLPPRKEPAFPLDLAFGLYDTIAVFDVHNELAWVIAPDEIKAKTFADRLGEAPLDSVPDRIEIDWTADMSSAVYRRRVAEIIEAIRAGDIYQANLTQRWTTSYPRQLAPYDLYRRLRTQTSAPFAAYMSIDRETQIISASPERFLSVNTAGHVETWPIKGTRPRGATPEEDRALAAELNASAKDRAENLMIVDLLRNDISRACAPGSVKVPVLCGLETFPRLHHLVSVVTGQLRPECSAIDLMAACFPGGSITGAPKIRAMEIIHDLEPVARGPYCGSLAWFGWDGAMDSSIVIRTLVRSGDTLAAQAGGGIVADSDPAAEYDESVLKAQPLLMALNGHGRFSCPSV